MPVKISFFPKLFEIATSVSKADVRPVSIQSEESALGISVNRSSVVRNDNARGLNVNNNLVVELVSSVLNHGRLLCCVCGLASL